RLERRQLSPAENSEKQKDEHERGGRAQDDVHGSPQGKTVTVLVSSASPCAPSRSRTPCERRPTVVGSTWLERNTVSVSSAASGANASATPSGSLVSFRGCGTIELSVKPSSHPSASTIVGRSSPLAATTWIFAS